jgi:hypothetical protein
MCLNAGVPAEAFAYEEIMVEGDAFQVTEEMVEAVQLYLDTVAGYIRRANEQRPADFTKPVFAFETRFDLSSIHEGMFGTADFQALLLQERTLVVADYKHGAGVAVEVEDNTQLLYYGLGGLLAIPDGLVDSVEIVVVQPRAIHGAGGVRTVKYSAKWLLETFAERLRDAAVATTAEDAPLKAGSHCRWCRAKASCPAKHNLMTASTGATFENTYKLPEVSVLTPAQMAKVLDAKKDIESWLDAVAEAAANLVHGGETVPGYKLVRSSKNRTWVDKQAAEAYLTSLYGDEVLKRELKGLGDMEKVLKNHLGTKKAVDEVMNSLVYKPEGDIVLAPLADKRPEVNFGALLEAVAL